MSEKSLLLGYANDKSLVKYRNPIRHYLANFVVSTICAIVVFVMANPSMAAGVNSSTNTGSWQLTVAQIWNKVARLWTLTELPKMSENAASSEIAKTSVNLSVSQAPVATGVTQTPVKTIVEKNVKVAEVKTVKVVAKPVVPKVAAPKVVSASLQDPVKQFSYDDIRKIVSDILADPAVRQQFKGDKGDQGTVAYDSSSFRPISLYSGTGGGNGGVTAPVVVTPPLLLPLNNIFVGNASSVPTPLAPGTAGQVLQISGGVPTWVTLPASGSGAWSDLTNPTSDLLLTMGTNATTFEYASGTGANNLFNLTSVAAANGTGSLLNIQSGAGATLSPLRVRAGAAEAVFVGANGRVGVGTISPTALLSVGAAGNAGVVALAGATSGVTNIAVPTVAGTYTLTLPANAGTVGQILQTDGVGNTSWVNQLADPGSNGILVRTAPNTVTARVLTGTAGRVTVTNANGVAGNPTVDIDPTYAGQGSITTVGTVTSGVWQGGVIGTSYGGTNSSSVPTSGGVAYGDGSAYQFTPAGISGQILTSGGAGAPTWTDASGLGVRWNAIQNPNGNSALSMLANTTSWNWATGTGANNLLSLTTDAAANGTGALLNIQTGAGATVLPVRVRAGSTEAIAVDASGNVGFGTTVPSALGAKLVAVSVPSSTAAANGVSSLLFQNQSGALGDVNGVYSGLNLGSNTARTITNYNGFYANMSLTGDNATITNYRGALLSPTMANASGTNITNFVGLQTGVSAGGGSGTITRSYGIKIDQPSLSTGAGTNYGIYIANQANAIAGTISSNYQLYSDTANPFVITSGGNVGVGNSSPSALLSVGTAGTVRGNIALAGQTSGVVSLRTADTTATYTLTLPTSAGTNGQVLQTDGAGVLSWTTAGAGGVTSITAGAGLDGGTITTTGTVSIATNGVVDSMIRQSAGLSIIGRSAATTGNVADIVAGSDGGVLRRSGSTIGFGTIPNTSVTGLGTLSTQNGTFSGTSSGTNTGDQTITLTGDVTGSGTGSFATTISSGVVTYSKLQNASANTVLARSAGTSGSVSEVALSNSELLGRGAAGNIAAISLGSGLSMVGNVISATGSSGGVSSVGTIDSQTKSANGAVIVATDIFLQNADASFPGLVSTGTQTLAGSKTLTGDNTLIKPGTNSTTAFQVQPSTSTTPVLNVDTTNSFVGIGTAAPAYLFDVRTASSAANLHLGTSSADSGLYLVSNGASVGYLSGGAAFNGSSWVAKTTTANIVGGDNGNTRIFGNTGLTVGNTYTPTERFTILGSSGNTGINAPSPASTLSVGGGATVGSGYTGTAAPSNSLLVQSAIGIANTSPSALLTLGTAGTTGGTLSLAGSTSGVVTINTNAAAGTYTLTLPNSAGSAGQFLQTDGSGGLSWVAGSGGSGVTTIGTIDSQTKSADGAVISGANLVLQNADGTFPGLVSTGTQTFAGAKTFTTSLSSPSLSNSGNLTLNASGSNSLFLQTNSTNRLSIDGTGAVSVADTGGFGTVDFTTNGTAVFGQVGGVYAQSPSGYPTLGFNSYYAGDGVNYTAGQTGYGGAIAQDYVNGGFLLYTQPVSLTAGTGRQYQNSDIKVRILSGGQVGLSNINPSALLTLGTAGTTAGTLSMAGSTSGTVTLQTAATAGTWTMTLPTTAGSSGQVLQTNGSGVTSWVTVSGGGGVTTVGTLDSETKSSNGAVIAGVNIVLQAADASFPGLVTATGTQAFAGTKQFTGDTSFTGGVTLVKPAANSVTAFQVQPSASTTPVLNVDTTNSRVGIGTASPVYQLEVSGSAALEQVVRIANSGAGGAGFLDIYASRTGGFQPSTFGINTQFTNSPFLFNQGGFEVARFNSSGNFRTVNNIEVNGSLGVGTASPSSRIHLRGSGVVEFARVETTAGGNTGSLDIYASGSGGFQAGTVGFNTSATNTPILFNQGGFEVARFTATNNFQLVNSLQVANNITAGPLTAPSDINWAPGAGERTLLFSGNAGGAYNYASMMLANSNATPVSGDILGAFGFGSRSGGPGDTYSGIKATIAGLQVGSGGSNTGFGGAIQFNTRIDNGAYGERMRITDTGLVGIGNNNPVSLLTLGTAGTRAGTLSLAGLTSGTVTLQTAAAAGTYSLTLPTDDGTSGQVLQTDGSGVLSWTSSGGSLAIGAIDSETKSANGAVITGGNLVLQNADSSFPGLVSTGTQTLAGSKTLTGNATLVKPGTNSTTAFQVQPAASTTPVFNVDTTNGRIGVNTSTPLAAVDVQGGSQIPYRGVSSNGDVAQYAGTGAFAGFRVINGTNGTPYIALNSSADPANSVGTQQAFYAYFGDSNAYAGLGYGLNSEALTYKTAGGTAGFVGIGTNAPSARLTVSGTTSDQFVMRINTTRTGDGTSALEFNRASTAVENGFWWKTNEAFKFFVGQNNQTRENLMTYNQDAGRLATYVDGPSNGLQINAPVSVLDVAPSSQVGIYGSSTSIPTLTLQPASGQTADIQQWQNSSGTAVSVLSAAGRLGLGNTAPSALLTLGTAGSTAGTLSLAGSTSGVVTLQTAAAAGTYTLTLPTDDGASGQVLQTDGSGGLSWVNAASSLAVGTIDSQTKSANGAVITGGNLVLQNADASFPGLVSTGTQTFAGAKTFNTGAQFNAGIQLGGTPTGLDDVNVIYNTTSAQTLGFIAGSTRQCDANNGPCFAARGNTYSAIANQRGSMYYVAGNPSTPVAGEGELRFYTGNTQLRMIVLNNGNVGIGGGITNPSDTLTVSGTASISGTTLLGPAGGTYVQNIASSFPTVGFNSFYPGSGTNYNAGATGFGSMFQFGQGDGALNYYTNTSLAAGAGDPYSASDLKISILNNGRVGLSNSTPGALLSLGTAGTTAGTLSLAGGTSGTVTLQTAAAAGTYTLTLPNSAGSNGQVLQTNGSGVLSWAAAGTTVIGTIDSQTKSANGAVISSSDLVLQNADASFPGLVSTGTQTIAGSKTLTGNTTLIKPGTNSVTAFQVQPSASTTPVLNVDTTNSRIGVNTSSPTQALQVAGGGVVAQMGGAAGGFITFSDTSAVANGAIGTYTGGGVPTLMLSNNLVATNGTGAGGFSRLNTSHNNTTLIIQSGLSIYNGTTSLGANSSFIFTSTNRLGIGGTTSQSPLTTLHVQTDGGNKSGVIVQGGSVMNTNSASGGIDIGQSGYTLRLQTDFGTGQNYIDSVANDANTKTFFRMRTAGTATTPFTLMHNAVGVFNTTPSALLTVGTAGTTAGTLSLAGATSGTVTLQTAAAAGTWSMTLPTTGGTTGYVLTTDGSGVTSWSDPAALAVKISSLVNPTANLSLNMSTFTTGLNWATGTSTNNLFSLTTDASADGTGVLLNVQTGASSTVIPMRVRAGSTEAIYVNTSGQVGLQNATPGYILHVGSSSVTSGTTVARFENAGGTCDITPNVSGGITCTSDARMKRNINNYDGSLAKLLQIQTVSYHLNPEGDNEPLHIGFVAQDLLEIVPDLVRTDDKGMLSVSYSGLTPYLVQGVQQLQAQISSLQAQIGQLSSQKLVMKDTLYLTGDNVGQGQIRAGTTTVRVLFSKPYEYQPIVTLTPNSRVGAEWWVSDKTESGFNINIDHEVGYDVVFDWHAFAGESSQLTIAEGATVPIVLQKDLPPTPDPVIVVPTAPAPVVPTEPATPETPTETAPPVVPAEPVVPTTSETTVSDPINVTPAPAVPTESVTGSGGDNGLTSVTP